MKKNNAPQPSDKPKVFTLIGKNGKDNIRLTIEDLIPIPHKDSFDFYQLVNLISYRDYEPVWSERMEEEHGLLYLQIGNKPIDFFKVKDEDLIIIPGTYIYPTNLTEQQITNGF